MILLEKELTGGMIFTRPGKCRYGIPSHTVPFRGLGKIVDRLSKRYTAISRVRPFISIVAFEPVDLSPCFLHV